MGEETRAEVVFVKAYYVLNYGCQMNEADGERYAGQLEELGYQACADFRTADIIVVNTCCVRESAEKRIAGKLGQLAGLKKTRPGLVLCVTGCLAQKEGEGLQRRFPQLDLVLGTAYVNQFKTIVADYVAEGRRSAFVDLAAVQGDEFAGSKVRQSSFSAWLPIMYGCNNFCTYCIVPYVRGRERSRSQESILAELEQAVAEGYKEVTLLGQNVDSYGKDRGEAEGFARLLRLCDQVEGLERLRFMTSHPRDMTAAVIQAVAESRHICHHFHLPCQAGNNEVLRRMNRGYTRERYLELVAGIRSRLPEAAITTDIIVGFPGEDEAAFADTLDLVREAAFDSAFTFIYSPRSGTPAATMPEQVPLAVKKQRLQRLMDLQNSISLAKNQALVGRVVAVLAAGPSKQPGIYSGRTGTGKLVLWPALRPYRPGELVYIAVEEGQTWQLKGREAVGEAYERD